jgi:uncharacterized membrane protein
MSKFIVSVFPDEVKAYDGLHALQHLHADGTVTVYGTAVLQRQADGTLSVKESAGLGPVGLGMGGVIGALIGIFGGPIGGAIGLGAGSMVGYLRDYFHAEVNDEFLSTVAGELMPGKFAVVAEVSEEWTAPINVSMEGAGGTVVRVWREDYVDGLFERRADLIRDDLTRREAEQKMKHAEARAERMDAKLSDQTEDARQQLEKTAQKARERLDQSRDEMEAKLDALNRQAADAKPETKLRIQQRVAELRKEFGAREKLLNHAYELTQQALHP